jgi:ATP-dependent protease ClpP protease subunit
MAANGVGEMTIYGEIGGGGVSAIQFRQDLITLAAASPAEVRLRIHSPGGDMFEGLAIYNCVKALNRPVTVVVDGVAASAASLIACAGNPVVMPSNTFLMIHNPFTFTGGDSEDLLAAAEALGSFTKAMANIYAGKSSLPESVILNMMSKETWLSAGEAYAYGLCDQVTDSVQIAACAGLSKFKGTPPSLKEIKTLTTKTENLALADSEAVIRARLEAEIRASVEAESKARVEEISSLCKLAGKPQLAATYLAEGRTAGEVKALLLANSSASPELNVSAPSGSQPANQGKPSATLNFRAIWANWNRKRGQAVPSGFIDYDKIAEELNNRA